MSKKISRVMLTVIAAFLVLAPLASAGHGGGHGGKRGGKCCAGKDKSFDDMLFFKAHFLMENAEVIGLSEEQKEMIGNLKYETKKSLIQQEADIETAKLEIKHKMHQSPLDVEGIKAFIDQKYDLKKAKTKYVFDAYAKLRNSLSEEQVAKMKELFKQGGGQCPMKKK